MSMLKQVRRARVVEQELKKGTTKADLAALLEVDEKTVIRAFDTLRQLGCKIEMEQDSITEKAVYRYASKQAGLFR